MSDPVEITDHLERGLANFTSKFRGAAGEISENLKKLATILLNEVQTVEELMFSLIGARYIAEAGGAQLNQYGSIVGCPRDGLSDDDYRGFIQAQIITNLAEGEIPRILQIIALITRSDSVRYYPTYPASYVIEFDRTTPMSEGLRDRVFQQLVAVTPAAVGVMAIEVDTSNAAHFDAPLDFDVGVFSTVIGSTYS